MRILVGVAACLAAVTAPAAASIQETIHRYLTGRDGAPFSGVVVVVDQGDVVFERAYGFADADLSVPIKTDMRFGIGSLTKPITAAAAMRLIEKGKLALSDPICKYVRDCPPAWGAVTVEHLLSHTSSIPDFFGDVDAVPVAEMGRAVADAVAKVGKTRDLKTVPGSAYAYSNFGYCLLAQVMEAATGSLWQEILREEVFAPAGMQDTEYDDVWRILRGRVRGYNWG